MTIYWRSLVFQKRMSHEYSIRWVRNKFYQHTLIKWLNIRRHWNGVHAFYTLCETLAGMRLSKFPISIYILFKVLLYWHNEIWHCCLTFGYRVFFFIWFFFPNFWWNRPIVKGQWKLISLQWKKSPHSLSCLISPSNERFGNHRCSGEWDNLWKFNIHNQFYIGCEIGCGYSCRAQVSLSNCICKNCTPINSVCM